MIGIIIGLILGGRLVFSFNKPVGAAAQVAAIILLILLLTNHIN